MLCSLVLTMGPSSSLKREVFFLSFSYGRSSHFFSVGYYCLDFSSLRRELIDSCCYLRGFNAPVAGHVSFQLTSALPMDLCFAFSNQCSSYDVQVYVRCSTVVGYVQSCSDFSRGAIQLAPSIESNVPHQDVIVQMFSGYPSSS